MAQANANTGLTVPGEKYCIHVTNLCPSVSAEQLAKMFGLHAGLIIIDTVEKAAWIKNLHTNDIAEYKARQNQNKRIGKQSIKCRAMQEQVQLSELCLYFRNNTCQHGDRCIRKHVNCQDYDTCIKQDCYLGHSGHESLPQSVSPIDFNGKETIMTHALR